MRYLGGKAHSAKFIAPFIQKALHKLQISGKTPQYLEPFCGGCNIIAVVKCPVRIASDIHEDLILMWTALQKGELSLPQCMTLEAYKKLKDSSPSALRGFVGFSIGFGGIFYGNYSRITTGESNLKSSTTFLNRGRNGVLAKLPYLVGVKFHHCDYKQWKPRDIVIYCDPPYIGTYGYKETPDFDHKEFWDVMRAWSRNNTVFISEQNAPPDFTTVWEKEVRRTCAGSPVGKQKLAVKEKLFQYKGATQ